MIIGLIGVTAGWLQFAGAATFTDTPTLTATPTLSATPTNTISPTASPTRTISATFTASPTVSPTPSISPTITVSPTATEVINVVVRINHNYFNPLRGQRVEVMNLNSQHGKVTIQVFNQTGYLICELLHDQTLERGTIPVWNGSNQQGEVVASGVYIIVVNGNKLHKRFRVAVIK